MSKPFVVAFATAFGLGFLLVNPWTLLYYIFPLAVATAASLIVVIFSLARRTKDWKVALLCLAVAYTPVLSSYGIQTYMRSRIVAKRKYVINALYGYRDKYGHFPQTIMAVSSDISSLGANYVPDSKLKDFTLYTRDIYGFPWVFKSKDSAWGR